MSDYLRALATRAAIPNNQRAVLTALCDAAGEDDGTSCYPSQEYLAYKTRYSVRQVRRIIETLETKKYIVSRVVDYTGWGHNTSYRIFIERVPMVAPWAEVKAKIRKRAKPEPVKAAENSPDILSAVSPDILSAVSPDILSGDSKVVPYNEPLPISKNSLAPCAKEGAIKGSHHETPATDSAPPDRRTRERGSKTAMERDPLFAALASELHTRPITRHEWGQWAKCINDLNEIEATPGHVIAAVRAFHRLYPQAQCTVFALLKNWGTLTQKASNGHGAATVKTAAQVDAEHAAARAEYEQRAAQWAALEAELVADGIVSPPLRR